jgi:hypothetical protein
MKSDGFDGDSDGGRFGSSRQTERADQPQGFPMRTSQVT